MTIRFCDDRGAHGFSWLVEEPMTRTSHVLAADGRVWLVDPVRHEPALWSEHARSATRSPSCSCSIATTATAPPSPTSSGSRTS